MLVLPVFVYVTRLLHGGKRKRPAGYRMTQRGEGWEIRRNMTSGSFALAETLAGVIRRRQRPLQLMSRRYRRESSLLPVPSLHRGRLARGYMAGLAKLLDCPAIPLKSKNWVASPTATIGDFVATQAMTVRQRAHLNDQNGN